MFTTYIVKFMIANMAKRQLSYLQHLELFLPAIPILLSGFVSYETEIQIVWGCLIGVTLYLAWIFYALSTQVCTDRKSVV